MRCRAASVMAAVSTRAMRSNVVNMVLRRGGGVTGARLQVLQALVEERLQLGPADLDEINQNRQRDRGDDQHRLDRDGASLVAVNPREQARQQVSWLLHCY